MRKTNLFIAVAAFTAVAASSLSAQSADRKGFYVDVAANYSIPSSELTDGSETIKDTQGGVGYALGVGFGLNNKWRLGAQVDYFKTSDAYKDDIGTGTDQTLTIYSAAITFYPSPTNNFWIRANLGYGDMSLSGGGSASASGFAWGLGVGYDWMLGKGGFALVPYASYMDLNKTGDFGGDFEGDGVTGKDGVFQIGVAIGYKH